MKRKNHDGENGSNVRKAAIVEEPRGSKRGSDDLGDNDGMNDWLHEILRLPSEACTDVVIFEIGAEHDDDYDHDVA